MLFFAGLLAMVVAVSVWGSSSSPLLGWGGAAAGLGFLAVLGCGQSELDREVARTMERYKRDVEAHKSAHPPFDAAAWLRAFSAPSVDQRQRQALRVKIYEGTTAAVAGGAFQLPSGAWVRISSPAEESTIHGDDITEGVVGSSSSSSSSSSSGEDGFGGTIVEVRDEDCVDCALACAAEGGGSGGSVALLNMAHPTSPGGHWERGVGSQEETLCRRPPQFVARTSA